MTVKLTKKQLILVNFIEDFVAENGFAPTYREIMTGLGLSSVSAVSEHIDNLIEKGIIRKNPGAARSLELLNFRHEETVDLFNERFLTATDEEKAILKKAAEILNLDLQDTNPE